MDARPNANENSGEANQQPAIAENASTPPPIDAPKPDVIPDLNEIVASIQESDKGHQNLESSKEPLLVHVIKQDDAPTSFERKTLTLGRLGILLSFLVVVPFHFHSLRIWKLACGADFLVLGRGV